MIYTLEDYKIIAVKYYLENDTNYTKTCEIFKCSERSLKRWIERYEELEEIKRLNRKPKSYKITKDQVKYSIQKLKENEQITMEELQCREKKDDVKVEKPKKDKVKKVVPDFSKSSKDRKVRQKKANKSVKVVALTKS